MRMTGPGCIDEDTALALVGGRLLATSRQGVERHLESCDACRELCVELAQMEGARSRSQGGRDTQRGELDRSSIPPGTRIERYQIAGEIGRGAAGTVYRAVDTTSGVTVAIKHVVEPALRLRFSREVATLARLDHPAIVRYVGHGELRDGMFLAMEWLEGEDLQQRLAREPGNALGWRAARAIGVRLAGALGQAHALGCVHRDLSSRNVFLPFGRVEEAKLLDFGLVRLIDPAVVDATRTQAVLGTPFYMSPEQVRDPRQVDGRSDLFGLGVLLYEVTTGVRPFSGEQLFTVWDQIVNKAPAPLQSLSREPLPPAFAALVEALLQKDPRARPPSGQVVQQALAAIGDPLSLPPPMPMAMAPLMPAMPSPMAPALTVPPASHGRGVTVVVVGALVAIALALVGGVGVGAYVLVERFGSNGEAGGTSTPASPPAATPASTPAAPAAPVAPVPPAHAGRETGTPFQCTGGTETTLRHGHYAVDADHPNAVQLTGCHITLEDCVINGPSLLAGPAELTLRRCQVHGSIKLVGPPTLRLDHTALPTAPEIVGQGHVVEIGG